MTKEEPLIQVIVCTYQGERFITEQLTSILDQSYVNFEVLVFDDRSTDQTCDIVGVFCQKFSNIVLYKNTNNLGFLGNFEQALNSASAAYIALSDQDDIWHKDKLQLCMEALMDLEKKQPNLPVLVHSDLSYIDDKGEQIHGSFFEKKGLTLPNEKSLSHILGHCGVMGNTILMNRILVDKALPFPEGLKYHDYWFAVVNEIFGIRKAIQKPLVGYRIHNDNNSANNRIIKTRKSWFKKRAELVLPFMDDHREIALQKLLSEYPVGEEDYQLIQGFCNYLTFKGSRLSLYLFLLRKGFFKEGVVFRLASLYRILFTTRYDR